MNLVLKLRSALIAVLLCGVSAIFAVFALVAFDATRSPPRSSTRYPSLIQADSAVGFAPRPSIAVEYPVGAGKHFNIFTDARGVRASSPKSTPLMEASLVAIGDSQTFGWGISYDDTYLAKSSKALGTTAANLAVSGYGTISAMRRLKQFATLRPSVVILGYYFDHPARNLSRCYPGFSFECMSVPYVQIDDKNFTIVEPQDNTPVIQTLRDYEDYISGPSSNYSFGRDMYWVARRLHATNLFRNPYVELLKHTENPELASSTEFLLTELVDLVRRMNASLVIVYIPDYFKSRVIPPPAYLTAWAERLDVPFIDMTANFQAALKREADSIKIPGDGHLNELGHEMIAQCLVEVIRLRHLLEIQRPVEGPTRRAQGETRLAP